MADRTGIEWTDATWNPIRGCSRVSDGCRNCYAERVAARFSGPGQPYEGLLASGGQWNGQIKLVESVMDQPLRWRRPRRIFVNSMSDLFHEAVPDEVIDRVFAIMALCPQHTFQVLTKRPERMQQYICGTYDQWHGNPDNFADRFQNAMDWNLAWINDIDDMPWPLKNVWLGVSIENQATANVRIPLLLETPAAVRWVSAEPLLGRVDLCEHLGMWWNQTMDSFEAVGARINSSRFGGPGIGWVVVGGESGPGARPMHLDWARAVRNQCQDAGVPFLFKQWGEWEVSSVENGHHDCSMTTNDAWWVDINGNMHKPSSAGLNNPIAMTRVGKKAAGRMLDGRTWDEYPEPHPCQPT